MHRGAVLEPGPGERHAEGRIDLGLGRHQCREDGVIWQWKVQELCLIHVDTGTVHDEILIYVSKYIYI